MLRRPDGPLMPVEAMAGPGLTGHGLVLLAVVAGAVLQGATGLGAGLVSVPIVAHVDPGLVPGALVFGSLPLSLGMTWHGRGDIVREAFGWLLAGLAAGAVATAAVLPAIPAADLPRLFGAVLLLAVVASLAGRGIALRPAPLLAAGVVSAAMGTAAGVGGPVLALVYQHESGPRLRATLAALYLLSSVVMLAALAAAGRFGPAQALAGALLMPGFLCGWLLAAPLARRLDGGPLRAVVVTVAIAGALSLLARGG